MILVYQSGIGYDNGIMGRSKTLFEVVNYGIHCEIFILAAIKKGVRQWESPLLIREDPIQLVIRRFYRLLKNWVHAVHLSSLSQNTM